MALRYPNTDGTVKGLLEVVSRDYEHENRVSNSPPPLFHKAAVSPIGPHNKTQVDTTDTESVQRNSVFTDKSSPQPPIFQSVSHETSYERYHTT